MRFEYSGTVTSTPGEVFGLIADIERKHEWVGEVVASRRTSPGPTGVGTTYVDVVRFMGRTSEIPTVVTRYEPGHRLSYRHTGGPIQGELDYVLRDAPHGTTLAVSIDAEMPVYLRLLGPLLQRQLRAQMDANFAALTRALEQTGRPNAGEPGLDGSQL